MLQTATLTHLFPELASDFKVSVHSFPAGMSNIELDTRLPRLQRL
jgi:hypothetical protein